MEQARKKSKINIAVADIYIYSMNLNTSTFLYNRKLYADVEHGFNPQSSSWLFQEKFLTSR